jgi:hypothetical protein
LWAPQWPSSTCHQLGRTWPAGLCTAVSLSSGLLLAASAARWAVLEARIGGCLVLRAAYRWQNRALSEGSWCEKWPDAVPISGSKSQLCANLAVKPMPGVPAAPVVKHAASLCLCRQLLEWIYRRNAQRCTVSNIPSQKYQLTAVGRRTNHDVSASGSKASAAGEIR